MESLASNLIPTKQSIVSSTSKRNKRSVTILPPTLATTIDKKTKKPFILEYSVHLASNRFNRELKCIFPQVEDIEKCLVIPTFLKCEHDLVGIGAVIDHEKDEKLEV
ncbi:6488_t:CDS:1, partial [Funneliformis caledonium]